MAVHHPAPERQPSAAFVLVGNELLTGKFADENGPFLTGRLRELGIALRRVVVIPDTIDDIAEEVARCSARYTWVFTSGGVGPTHDDLTFAGVAAAFGVGIDRHPELARRISARLDGQPSAAALRMAEIPTGSELWWPEGLRYPLVVLRNVLIFPGVPSIFRLKFDAVADRLRGRPLSCARVTTGEDEVFIAARLEEAVSRWPGVEIGSYPRFDDGPHHVIVTVEGLDPAEVAACRDWLAGQLAPFPAG